MKVFVSHVDTVVGRAVAHVFALLGWSVFGNMLGRKDLSPLPPKSVSQIFPRPDQDVKEFERGIRSCNVIVYDLEVPHHAKEACEVVKRSKRERTFLLLSSLMTWARSPYEPREEPEPESSEDPDDEASGSGDEEEEEEPEPSEPSADEEEEEPEEFGVAEGDYVDRRPHRNFREHLSVERAVAKAIRFQEHVSGAVINAGAVYGRGETVFRPLFRAAYEGRLPLPVFGGLDRVIPTIHALDLATVVFKLAQEPPENMYVFAVDEKLHTVREITEAIAQCVLPNPAAEREARRRAERERKRRPRRRKALREWRRNRPPPLPPPPYIYEVPFKQYDLLGGIDELTINLPVQREAVADLEVDFISRSFVRGVHLAFDEFLVWAGLVPPVVAVAGPPRSGKTAVAALTSKQLGVALIGPDTIVEVFRREHGVRPYSLAVADDGAPCPNPAVLPPTATVTDESGRRVSEQWRPPEPFHTAAFCCAGSLACSARAGELLGKAERGGVAALTREEFTDLLRLMCVLSPELRLRGFVLDDLLGDAALSLERVLNRPEDLARLLPAPPAPPRQDGEEESAHEPSVDEEVSESSEEEEEEEGASDADSAEEESEVDPEEFADMALAHVRRPLGAPAISFRGKKGRRLLRSRPRDAVREHALSLNATHVAYDAPPGLPPKFRRKYERRARRHRRVAVGAAFPVPDAAADLRANVTPEELRARMDGDAALDAAFAAWERTLQLLPEAAVPEMAPKPAEEEEEEGLELSAQSNSDAREAAQEPPQPVAEEPEPEPEAAPAPRGPLQAVVRLNPLASVWPYADAALPDLDAAAAVTSAEVAAYLVRSVGGRRRVPLTLRELEEEEEKAFLEEEARRRLTERKRREFEQLAMGREERRAEKLQEEKIAQEKERVRREKALQIPFRRYINENVMEAIISGLVRTGEVRPADPVTFLAEFIRSFGRE